MNKIEKDCFSEQIYNYIFEIEITNVIDKLNRSDNLARQYTKELIRKVFIQLLNQGPLAKITVKDIAETCEINRNTLL